jgi:glycosyltransferase involved in cell wall biosynthesis
MSKCIPNIIPIPSISTGSRIEQTKESDLHLLFAAVNPEAPTKGLDMLIAATSELALENPQVAITLNIVGKRVDTIPSSKNLTLRSHGFLLQEELAELFKKVHLVVVPSRIDNSPSIISEAQLNRVLVLATKVGGIPELVEDSITGLLCEPNANSLKLSIMRSVSLVNKEEIIEKGMKQASYRHNPESVVLSHIGVYQKLIAHG